MMGVASMKKHFKWGLIGLAVMVVIGIAASGGDDTDTGGLGATDGHADANADEQATDSVGQDSNGLPRISPMATQLTEDFFSEETLIEDVSVLVEGDAVTIAMEVNAATDPDWARQQLHNAARFLATMVAGEHDGLEGPARDDLGDLWDHYTLNVGAGTGPDNFIVRGAKVPTSPQIAW